MIYIVTPQKRWSESKGYNKLKKQDQLEDKEEFFRKIDLLAQKIVEAKYFIVFTGAGISTESGIPDYRSKGGIWDKFKPIYIDEFMSSHSARVEYWQRKSELYQDLIQAQPNVAHEGLAELFQMGLVKTIITQNIDGLHQKSGIKENKVVELHGNNLRVRCMSCGKISSIQEAQKRIKNGDLAPECSCGGYLKPDTISFGQSLDPKVLNRAFDQCKKCSLMLVIGSTLLVHPAASLPSIAQQNGSYLAIVNLSPTPADVMSDILIRQKAGITIDAIVKRVKQKMV